MPLPTPNSRDFCNASQPEDRKRRVLLPSDLCLKPKGHEGIHCNVRRQWETGAKFSRNLTPGAK